MPLPPPEEAENQNGSDEPKLQFSYVEGIMSAFHSLGENYPEFLTDEANADRLKDFRLRYVIYYLTFNPYSAGIDLVVNVRF